MLGLVILKWANRVRNEHKKYQTWLREESSKLDDATEYLKSDIVDDHITYGLPVMFGRRWLTFPP